MITPSVFLTASVFGLGGYCIGRAEASILVRKAIAPLRGINNQLIEKLGKAAEIHATLASKLMLSAALIRACNIVYNPLKGGLSTKDLCATHLLLEQGRIIAELACKATLEVSAAVDIDKESEKRALLMVKEALEKSAKIVK